MERIAVLPHELYLMFYRNAPVLKYYTFYLCLFFLLVFTSVKAQPTDYDFQYFSVDDGLSNQFVTDITEDQDGFIWLATHFGVNRFDGQEFKSYTSGANGLTNNDVRTILEEPSGKLWFISKDKLSVTIAIFDKKSERAKSFSANFPSSPFKEKEIFQLAQSKEDGNIWVTTNTGEVYRYDGTFKKIAASKEYKLAFPFAIEGEQGIWIGFGNKVVHLDESGAEKRRIELPKGQVMKFGKLNDGRYWATHHHRLVLSNEIFFIEASGAIESLVPEPESIWMEDKRLHNINFDVDEQEEDYFLYMGAGILKSYNTDGKTIYDFGEILHTKFVQFGGYDVLIDKKKNIWVGTDIGLILISPKTKLFQSYLGNKNTSIRGVEELDSSKIFVATYHGFYLVNKESGESQLLNALKGNNYGLGTTMVGSNIIIGTHGLAFIDYDIKRQEFQLMRLPKNQISEDVVLPSTEPDFFMEDSNGQIWIGGHRGLRWLDYDKKNVSIPTAGDVEEGIYNGFRINHLLETDEGILVSTDNGIFLIAKDGAVLKRFPALETFKISYLHSTPNGDLWMTTKGSGLLRWNEKTKHLQQWTIEDGLSHDYLYSIYEDEMGFFWIPSNNGLMRLNPKNFNINTFHKKDGLPSHEFNTFSRLVGEDGRIYLGTINGLMAFHPEDFKFIDENNSPMRILSFSKTQKDNDLANDASSTLMNGQTIYFTNEDKSINLSFALLDYQNVGQSKYAYKIEGYDEDWNYLNDNQLKINSLDYGKYILKIKGQGRYGKWSNQILSFPLVVTEPVYLKTWFIILVNVLLGIFGYLIFRWRIYHLEKDKLRLENVVATRTRELANMNRMKDEFFAIIAHDLRGPVISFQNISKKIKYLNRTGSEKDVEAMLQMVDKAAENINVLLDNLLNWALVQKGIFSHEPKNLSLKKLSEQTVELFEPMASIKGIKIKQDISKNILVKADEDAMNAILRNIISNALKFSGQGDCVSIDAKKENGNVLLEIRDSGVGMESDAVEKIFNLNGKKIREGTEGEKGSGLGLVLCKELLELNSGNISVESVLGKGTAFLISLPVG